jgi:hypothetical protein
MLMGRWWVVVAGGVQQIRTCYVTLAVVAILVCFYRLDQVGSGQNTQRNEFLYVSRAVGWRRRDAIEGAAVMMAWASDVR